MASSDPSLSPRQIMAAGRLLASKKAPYMTAAIHSLIPRELPGLNTMGVTDRGVLLWDPEWVGKLKPETCAWVLLHEVNHVLRHHSSRCKRLGISGRMGDPKSLLWNIAADCEINDDLRAMQGRLPEGAFYPETIGEKEGGLAETYYAALRKQAQDNPQSSCDNGDSSPQNGDPKAGAGWCGSGAGRELPGEPAGGGKDVADGEGRSEADLARMRNQVAEAVRSQVSRQGQGSVPMGLQVWAEGHLKPSKIPWQQLLARAVRSSVAATAGAADYSYARPARRQGAIGWGQGHPVMPTLRGPRPRACVLMDASGSMGQEELADALSEVNGILRKTGVAILFGTFDADSYGLKEVRDVRAAGALVRGGGGTDTRPAFAAVAALPASQRPTTIIVLTDTMIGGLHPDVAPHNTKVIWCGVGSNATQCCPWGTYIQVERSNS